MGAWIERSVGRCNFAEDARMANRPATAHVALFTFEPGFVTPAFKLLAQSVKHDACSNGPPTTGERVYCAVRGLEDFGLGKVIDQSAAAWTIEFFDSPSKRHLRKASAAQIIRKTLGPNTRIYLGDEASERWDVGRVLHDDGSSVEVRLAGKNDVVVPHDRVFVRWKKPISDPIEFLARGIAETPQYADARTRFLSSYLTQRAATGGISALLSSAIELNGHQVDVVRRILTDPTQRYLLADEVGLGKTIEAGVVIRQAVLDDPRGHNVVVLVPPALVHQWRQELADRFGLAAYLDDSVFVVSHSDERSVADRLRSANMLVVDEAHHITTIRQPGDSDMFEQVALAAKRVRRLLLLSATPVLRNELGFLRMLHLLDPQIYGLDREADFRNRVAHRQQLAEAVAILEPQNSLYFEPFLDDLLRILPTDQRLAGLILDLKKRLESLPENDEVDFVAAVRVLRTHLSETYRLHRRILRNRRRHVKWLTPNRSGSSERILRGSGWGRLEAAFENWRIGAVASTAAADAVELVNGLIEFCFNIVDALLAYPPDVQRLCTARMSRDGSTTTLFEGEEELLAAVADAARLLVDRVALKESLAATVVSELLRKETKVVIFCSGVDAANALFLHLRSSMPGDGVVRHEVVQFNEDEEPAGTAWLQFQVDPGTKVIVCDQAAEEGINLQGGRKAILHFDLPINPNRIEQRIGRLDRYSTGAPIESVVLIDEESPIESAWYRVLKDGLRVFDRPISSLQYLVEEQMQGLKKQLFLDGAAALELLRDALTGEQGLVEGELRRLEQQDALDELVPRDEEELDALVDADADWQEIRDATNQWAIGALLFEQVPSRSTSRDHPLSPPFRFRYVPPGKGGHATLIPLSSFVDRFLGALDYEAPGGNSRQPMSYVHSYHRKTAIKSTGRPLRYGSEFCEALKTFSDVDDRGRSYVCWRHVKEVPTTFSSKLYFRFSFLVEANAGPAREILASKSGLVGEDAVPSIQRQLDMAFSPSVTDVWQDENGVSPDGTSIQELLEGAYDKTGSGGLYLDTNLRTGRLARAQSRMPNVFGQWATLCRRQRDTAIDRVVCSEWLKRKIDEALSRLQVVQEVRLAQLVSRAQHLGGIEATGERTQLDLEKDLAVALQQGIRAPTVKIDVAGAVWLTDEPSPFQGQDEDRGWN
jgi:ATP-dependent helicase HepA